QTAQNEVLRSRTLITVGEMAAGAAHEMNNPLAVISGRSQLLSMQLADAKQKAAAALIFEQSHRLSQIISELMDFAKPMAPKPQDSDLAQIAQRAMQNAKAHNKDADTTVEATFTDMPPVTVDPQQVTDAVSEVIDNAFQSIEEGRGLITLHGAFDPFSQ